MILCKVLLILLPLLINVTGQLDNSGIRYDETSNIRDQVVYTQPILTVPGNVPIALGSPIAKTSFLRPLNHPSQIPVTSNNPISQQLNYMPYAQLSRPVWPASTVDEPVYENLVNSAPLLDNKPAPIKYTYRPNSYPLLPLSRSIPTPAPVDEYVSQPAFELTPKYSSYPLSLTQKQPERTNGVLPPHLPICTHDRVPAFVRPATQSFNTNRFPMTSTSPPPTPTWCVSQPIITPTKNSAESTASPITSISVSTKAPLIRNRDPPTKVLRCPPVIVTGTPVPTTIISSTHQPLELTGALELNSICRKGNGYYAVANECDTYIECQQGTPRKYSCPYGLHFNPAAQHYEYPCAYPSEVKATTKQSLQSTSQCPTQDGLFSLDDGDCSRYIVCHAGVATIMNCPPGLVFNSAISSCDWPEKVPQCNPNVFKNFNCPEPPINIDGSISEIVYMYRYEEECQFYIACQKGYPRLLSCEPGLAFDEDSQSCIDENSIARCAKRSYYNN